MMMLVLILSMTSVACDDIVNEILDEAVDCVFKITPELKGELNKGSVGDSYSGTIRASAKNTPFDDSFDYFFDIQGSIPPGLEYNIYENKVRLSGTPTEAGLYRITVHVEIEDTGLPEDERLCLGQNSQTKDFTIEILP